MRLDPERFSRTVFMYNMHVISLMWLFCATIFPLQLECNKCKKALLVVKIQERASNLKNEHGDFSNISCCFYVIVTVIFSESLGRFSIIIPFFCFLFMILCINIQFAVYMASIVVYVLS